MSGIDRRGVEVGEGLGGSEVCLGGSEVIWGSVVMVAVVVGVGGLEGEGVWMTCNDSDALSSLEEMRIGDMALLEAVGNGD